MTNETGEVIPFSSRQRLNGLRPKPVKLPMRSIDGSGFGHLMALPWMFWGALFVNAGRTFAAIGQDFQRSE